MGSCCVAALGSELSLAAWEATHGVGLRGVTWRGVGTLPRTAAHCSQTALTQVTWRGFRRCVLPHGNVERAGVIPLPGGQRAASSLRSRPQERETFRRLSLRTDALFRSGMVGKCSTTVASR